MSEKYLKTKDGSIEDTVKLMQNKVLESDYKDKFKKALDKEGKPLGHMTGAEKKAFFGKVDSMHTAKDEATHTMPDGTVMKGAKHKEEVKEEDAYDGTPAEVAKLKAKEKADAEKAKSKKEEVNEGITEPNGTISQKNKDLLKVNNYITVKGKVYVIDKVSLVSGVYTMKAFDKNGKMHTISSKDVDSIEHWKKSLQVAGYNPKNEEDAYDKDDEKPKSKPKKEEVSETHTGQTATANRHQKSAGGEKSPISHMVNKSIKEITKDDGKTFAQMRAEIEESKDSERTYPSKETKIKGSNPADKGEKEHQTGEDTRDPKKKAMSGGIATTPEMNPKVDYKY